MTFRRWKAHSDLSRGQVSDYSTLRRHATCAAPNFPNLTIFQPQHSVQFWNTTGSSGSHVHFDQYFHGFTALIRFGFQHQLHAGVSASLALPTHRLLAALAATISSPCHRTRQDAGGIAEDKTHLPDAAHHAKRNRTHFHQSPQLHNRGPASPQPALKHWRLLSP